MHLLASLFGALSVLLVTASGQSAGIPVLSYFKNSETPNTITVGQTLTADLFIQNIKEHIDAVPSFELIVLGQLRDENIRELISSGERNEFDSAQYEPSVESPYQSLVDTFKAKAHVTRASNVDDALALFAQKMSSSAAVIVTGEQSGVAVRLRRAVDDDLGEEGNSSSSNLVVVGDGCAATFKSLSIINQNVNINGVEVPLSVDKSSISFSCDNTSATLSMKFDNVTDATPISELKLIFNVNNLYWAFNGANSTVITSGGGGATNTTTMGLVYMGTPYGMESPMGFSFVCTRSYFLLKSTDAVPKVSKMALYINEFQLQPFGLKSAANSTTSYEFGKLNYCQGFFSSGIWMAITSLILMLLIMASGIVLLAGINTMDRFDDPKGKPLTIAQEK